MKTSARGIEFIKQAEGFRAEVYLDAAGKATIGYGHLIGPSERFDTPVTEQEAEAILARDIETAETDIARLVKVSLTQGQLDALVSFCFNLGADKIHGSSVLRIVNEQNHLYVPSEFMRWIHAGGRPLKGLALRRLGEATMYLKDTEAMERS